MTSLPKPLSLSDLATQSSWIEVKRQIQERMIYGCLPDVINEPRHAQKFLLDYVDALLYRDLLRLDEVRKPMNLIHLLTFLAANVGSVIRYGSIASELGIQNKTIERYVDLLASRSVVKVVSSWSTGLQTELTHSKTIYFCDNGVRNAVLHNFALIPVRDDKEALWKNLFFTERMKFHALHQDDGEIFFWKTKRNHQIDFVEVVDGSISAFECRLVNKPTNAISMKAFMRAYPNIPSSVVMPENVERFL